MASLSKLKLEATIATASRGHEMHWSAPWHGERTSTQNAECVHCGKYVQINTNPMPNEIDVGGDAVAIECDAA